MENWKGWVLAALIGSAMAPAFAQAGAPADAQVDAQVDLAPYLRRDAFESIKISPDGKHYAATVPLEDRTVLVIVGRSDKQYISKAAGVKDSVIADFWWANDERVVVAMAERMGSRDQPYRTGELHAVSIDGERAKTLVGRQPDPAGLVTTYGNTSDREYADFIDRVPDDPRSILIGVSDFSANPQTRVEKLDVYTGRRTSVTIAPIRRATLITDPRGQVRLAEGSRGSDNYSKLYHRESATGEWTLVNDEATSGHYEWPLGFSADGVTAYLRVAQPKGPDAIVAWNTRTGERKEALRDADVDPYALLFDRDGRTLIGAQYMSGGVRSRFFDEAGDTARAYRRLEKAFPGSTVSINSFTRDGRIALAQVWNDRALGDYYLYDTQT
ncbi:MAG TPA: S9 family peptidase, partial [Lysobacter sp.]